jgi:hypothetical protein
MMRIAFLHFHLKTGGVTSVIARQVEAVQKMGGEALIVSGEPAERPIGCEIIEIPQLAYDHAGQTPEHANATVRHILQGLRRYWTGGADIVHVHNPTLAKNRGLQTVLKGLQSSGVRLLCQIHDFAEEGRPDFFFEEPYVSDCHYAVLNRRDYGLLRTAGLEEQGLHLLPNPVAPIAQFETEHSPKTTEVLYPVRAIRRKNIGEALLLGLYFDPPARLAVTLPPNSPADRRSYRQWCRFATECGLNVRFEAGLQDDFSALISRCRYMVTTSISEGFGFAFLEPWTAGKPLWGRILPDICADFIENGLRLDHMYRRLSVPLHLFDAEGLRRRWQSAWVSAADRLGIELPQEMLQDAWPEVSRDDEIDFGLMDEVAQRQVILKVSDKRTDFELLKRLNPFLEWPGPSPAVDRNVLHNSTIVARHYSLLSYADRLHTLYERIKDAGTIRHAIDKRILTRAFLTPRTFSLLKWGSFDAAV